MLKNERVMARDLEKRVKELYQLKYNIVHIVHIKNHILTEEFEFIIFYTYEVDDDIPF